MGKRESYFHCFFYILEKKIGRQDKHQVLFFFLINLFNYFWLRWVFIAARGLSLAVTSGGYSLLQCTGFSVQWLLLLRSTGSRLEGFSSCGMQAQ